MKVNEIQEVFNYYDRERSGFIDYKKFAHELFYRKLESRENTQNTQGESKKSKELNDFNKYEYTIFILFIFFTIEKEKNNI